MKKFRTRDSYFQRRTFHLFCAALWSEIAKDEAEKLKKLSSTLSSTRDTMEQFIDRALMRAQDHYRAADRCRARGFEDRRDLTLD